MKATLVFPGITSCGFNSFGTDSSHDEANLMPHGLALISAYAKSRGHEIDLIDLRMLTGWEQFDEEVGRRGRTVYGVTSMSVDYGVAAQCMERIKRVSPESVVILGGVHASVDTANVVQNPNIDHIVTGEGEVTFSDLLSRLEEGDPLDMIPRVIPGEAPDVENIPWADRDLFRYREGELVHPWLPHLPAPFVTILVGRACPFRCNFCQPAERSVFGGKVRIRSAENVMGELRQLREKYDFKSILIHDDLFIIDRKRVEAFCEAYRANGFDQPFVCQVRVDMICRNEDLMENLAETGLSCVMIGYESGSQRVLDFMEKATTAEQNLKATEICRKYGIKVFADYMFGVPTETPREVMDTVRMLNTIQPDYASPSFFTPHPGTGLYDYCEEHSLSLVRFHESFRRNPNEAKIKGVDYNFLRYAVERSQEYRIGGEPEPVLNAAYFDLKRALDVIGKDDSVSRRKARLRALDFYYNKRYLEDDRKYEDPADDFTVALEACSRYDYRQVYRHVKACLAHLGGMEAFVKPGQRALLKVNLVGAHAPESAAVTHPNVVAAATQLVREAGGTPVIADWTGRPDEPRNYQEALECAGLKRVAEIFGVEILDLNDYGVIELCNPDGVAWQAVPATKALYEVDVVISLCKLKTHDLTGYTGAVKNVWGLLEGGARRRLHDIFKDYRQFSEALVDAYSAIRPALSLMDAVVSMEGEGPERGTPRQTGFIAASPSGPALDHTAASLVGIAPMDVATTASCARRRLLDEGEIRIAGCNADDLRQQDFKLPSTFRNGFPKPADVLVTGGTGYIGRGLVARLVEDGHRVVVPTRQDIPTSPDAPVDYILADINDATWTRRNVALLEGVKQVYHLAASLDYFGDESELNRINVDTTRSLLEWSLDRGVQRFVFASSIEAAGTADEGGLPIAEDRAPAPVSAYGKSKARAEAWVQAAVGQGLSTVSLRLGQVYGVGGMSFVLEVIKGLIKGGDLVRFLPVYGSHIIHPVYIDDVVSGLIAAAQGTDTGVYHLCGPEATTLGAVCEGIASALGLPLEIGERNAQDAAAVARHVLACRERKQADLVAYFAAGGPDAPHRAYAIDRVAADFGFTPSVDVADGVVRTLRWLQEQQDTQAA